MALNAILWGAPVLAILVASGYAFRVGSRQAKLIGAALLVSAVADIVALPYWFQQINNWWISFSWPVLAFPLILIATLDDRLEHTARQDHMMPLAILVFSMLTIVFVGGYYYYFRESTEALILVRLSCLLFLGAGVAISRARATALLGGLGLFYAVGGFFFLVRTAQAPGGVTAWGCMRVAQLGGVLWLLHWIRQSSIRSRSVSSSLAFSSSSISSIATSRSWRHGTLGSQS